MDKLYSKEYEKALLSAIFSHPDAVMEIPFIEEADFSEINKPIFSLIKNLVANRQDINKVIVAQKLKEIGVSFPNINTFEYIDALCLIPTEKESIMPISQELKKLSVRRQIYNIGANLQKEMLKGDKKHFSEIVSSADHIYNDKISLYYSSMDEPQNLFDGIQEEIESGEVKEEVGLKCPFPEFARLYGGFKPRNVYAIASRPGHGKTTFLDWTAFQVANVCNRGIPCLVLDTEMDARDVKLRLAAALSGVPMWYLETKNYRRNKEMLDKVNAIMPKVKEYKLWHLHVGNKSMDEIISIAKRWYYKNVDRGKPSFIVFDYLKLTGSDSVSDSWKEYQVIGESINKLKHDVAEELNSVVFTAIQLNRSGEGNQRNDTSSAMALSDRLSWIASYLAIFRRKYPDEIQEDGIDFGDHKLITLKTRFQGRDAPGHTDIIKRNGKYEYNFINYKVDNFLVEEKGSLQDIIARGSVAPHDHHADHQQDNDLPI